MPRLHRWLHRKGIARMINSSSNNYDERCTAYIEARGPRRLAGRLALYALRRSTSARKPDWQTVRVRKAEQPGRCHWRFHLDYRRCQIR